MFILHRRNARSLFKHSREIIVIGEAYRLCHLPQGGVFKNISFGELHFLIQHVIDDGLPRFSFKNGRTMHGGEEGVVRDFFQSERFMDMLCDIELDILYDGRHLVGVKITN